MKVIREPIYGVRGSSCTCGVHQVEGVMCRHAVAVAKSGRGEGLTLVNGMPYWWTTDQWRSQFPQDENARSCPSIAILKNIYEASDHLFFIPDFVGARKKGRPKTIDRYKSSLEKALRKIKGDTSQKDDMNLLTEAELEKICQHENDDEGLKEKGDGKDGNEEETNNES